MVLFDIKPKTRASVEALRARTTRKSAPGPDRFSEVPMAAVEAVGLWAERGPSAGQVKVDLALLAAAAWFYAVNAGRERVCVLATGDEVALDAETVWFSMETVGRNLDARWATEKPFPTLYENVKDGFRRLEKAGQIVCLGYPLGRGRSRLGRLWTLAGTPTGDAIAQARTTPRPEALLTARPAILSAAVAPFERDGMVNVVDLLGGLHAGELGLLASYTHAQVSEAITRRRGLRVYANWAARKARKGGDVLGDHGTTGLFRRSDIGDDRRPVDGASTFVPYLVIEIDRPSPEPVATRPSLKFGEPDWRPGPVDVEAVETSATVARRFVRALVDLGVAPRDLGVCFSGNRSFHVYVPAGAFGAPVFASADRVKPLLALFVASVLDEDVDEDVLSPRHLVRAVGARHEDTGKYKLAVRGDDFLAADLLDLYDRSAAFAPSTLPKPLASPPVPALVRLFVEALSSSAAAPVPVSRTAGAPGIDEPERWPPIYGRALEGCARGEVWWSGKSGRDSLVYELACFLLERADRPSATAVLEQVNARCTPPLSPHRLEAKIDSAEKTLGRKA